MNQDAEPNVQKPDSEAVTGALLRLSLKPRIGRPDVEDTIIRDMLRADQIKALLPQSAVSADAVFLAIRAATRPKRGYKPATDSAPPTWFFDALESLKGRKLTIGKFALLAGRLPMDKRGRNDLGMWLRQSGRMPYKAGGEQLFRI